MYVRNILQIVFAIFSYISRNFIQLELINTLDLMKHYDAHILYRLFIQNWFKEDKRQSKKLNLEYGNYIEV